MFLWNCTEFKKYGTVCTMYLENWSYSPLLFQMSLFLPVIGLVFRKTHHCHQNCQQFLKHVRNYMFYLRMPILDKHRKSNIKPHLDFQFDLQHVACSKRALHRATHQISWLQFGPRPSDRCKLCCCWLVLIIQWLRKPNQWESGRKQRRERGSCKR